MQSLQRLCKSTKGRFTLEGKIHLHCSSVASNTLQVLDIGNTLRHIGILEGTSLAARESPSLGPIAYYRRTQKCAAYGTLKGIRRPPAVNLHLESCKESSSCTLRASSILVHLRQV